jgi:hypothetical protein
MILFTNGCSFTWGGGFPFVHWQPFNDGLSIPNESERLSSVWPHHLGKLLNAEQTVNLSLGGGSNQRILRTTFDWLSTQSSTDLQNTVAVIQLTAPSRYEYYSPDDHNDRHENKSHRWALAFGDRLHDPSNESSESNSYKSNNKLHKAISSTYTEIEEAYKYVSVCGTIQSMLSNYNVSKCFFWTMDPCAIERLPPTFIDYLKTHFNWLSVHSFDTFDNDCHPTLTGHVQIADMIYSMIKDKV